METKAKSSFQKGILNFPENPVFKRYYSRYNIEPTSQQRTLPKMPQMNQINQMMNMDDSQLNLMLNMMKGRNSREQIERMYNKKFSDEEYERFMSMMNTDNFRNSIKILKDNPQMMENIKQMQNGNVEQQGMGEKK